MKFRSFDEIIRVVRKREYKMRCAVVNAEGQNTMEAVFRAYRDGIIDPILIGNKRKIRNGLELSDGSIADFTIIPACNSEEATQKAVDLINTGEIDCMMKGRLETGAMMRLVLSSKNRLKSSRTVSALNIMEMQTYHKLLAMTDGGITVHPDLNQKIDIIENAVGALRMLGNPCPKVAVMAAVETINPKIPETIDAAEIKKMNNNGEIINCIVEGPISYDLAISKEAALIKEYISPVAGDADLLVWPDINSGNLVAKSLIYSGGGISGACILGMKVPIILPSRAASTKEKYLSIVIATAIMQKIGSD